MKGVPGRGRTSLLNRLLSDKHGKGITIIGGEFGVDQAVFMGAQEAIFERNSRCIGGTLRTIFSTSSRG